MAYEDDHDQLKEGNEEELPLISSSGNVHQACKPYTRCLPARYVLAALLFFGLANVYAMRVNLSVALVAMTHQPGEPPQVSIDHRITTHSAAAKKNLLSQSWHELRCGLKTGHCVVTHSLAGWEISVPHWLNNAEHT